MEDKSKFFALLGRAMTDSTFRERLTSGDEGQRDALAEMDIEADDVMLEELNNAIGSINALASHDAFGPVPAVT
jgi:hypothetical protein